MLRGLLDIDFSEIDLGSAKPNRILIENICPVCKVEYEGLTNQVYCSLECKKKAENRRKKVRETAEWIKESGEKEAAALKAGNYALVRMIKAKRVREVTKLDKILGENSLIVFDPKIDIELSKLIEKIRPIVRKQQ